MAGRPVLIIIVSACYIESESGVPAEKQQDGERQTVEAGEMEAVVDGTSEDGAITATTKKRRARAESNVPLFGRHPLQATVILHDTLAV